MSKIKFILFICIFSFFGCKNNSTEKLRIATAANMQFVINDIVDEFTKSSGIECEVIVSSSGKLTAQINEGAPYDVFISANMKYPNDLFKKNLTIGKPKIYAFGKLVLWTMKDKISPSISILSNASTKHIALANPKTAPYGIAALDVLNRNNIFKEIENKLVFGESISQVNQFVTTQAAEVGFTAKSVVLAPHMKGKGNWVDIDESSYQPIKQGIVILKNDQNKEKLASTFSDFLFSKKGKEILNTFGYSTPSHN